MKKLCLIVFFIFSIGFISCSDKEKDEADLKQTKPEADSKPPVMKNQYTGITENGTIIEKADASFEEKIQEGEIIFLTNEGEPEPFEFGGSKIMAMQFPDGKLHQVEIENDRTWINVPEKGKMQAIRLNEKVYLFDDDNQAYEVKVMNNELVAEATDLTNVLLAMK